MGLQHIQQVLLEALWRRLQRSLEASPGTKQKRPWISRLRHWFLRGKSMVNHGTQRAMDFTMLNDQRVHLVSIFTMNIQIEITEYMCMMFYMFWHRFETNSSLIMSSTA